MKNKLSTILLNLLNWLSNVGSFYKIRNSFFLWVQQYLKVDKSTIKSPSGFNDFRIFSSNWLKGFYAETLKLNYRAESVNYAHQVKKVWCTQGRKLPKMQCTKFNQLTSLNLGTFIKCNSILLLQLINTTKICTIKKFSAL